MARTLIVLGVSVETRFDVPPPSFPIRNAARCRRRPFRGVTAAQELLDRFGPATRFSSPEVMDAVANDVLKCWCRRSIRAGAAPPN
jgi:hypothetical protein